MAGRLQCMYAFQVAHDLFGRQPGVEALTQSCSIENIHQNLSGPSEKLLLSLFPLGFACLHVAITLMGPPRCRGTSNRNGTAGKHDPGHRDVPILRRPWAGTSNTRGWTVRIQGCLVASPCCSAGRVFRRYLTSVVCFSSFGATKHLSTSRHFSSALARCSAVTRSSLGNDCQTIC